MALQRAATKLAQDIRMAQEMAIGAVECTVCTPVQVPPGYGIYIELAGGPTSQYILYADTQPSDGNEFYTSADSKIDEIKLPEGAVISQIFSGGQNRTRISINFRPPDPKTRIGWSESDKASFVIITLQLGSITKTIEVNEAGLTEIH
jgi:hypothetical protein